MAISKKKKFGVVGGVAALALTGGVAFAYWTSTGEDTTSAPTANENAWKVTVSGADAGILAPTVATGTPFDVVNFSFKNEQTGIKRVEPNTVVVTADAAATGCLDSDFAISNLTYDTTDIVPGATGTGSFEVRLINSSVNQDACKGTTVTYTVKVNPQP